MVLPTEHPQDLSKFSQFRFKYYGRGIRDVLVQLQTVEGTQIEIRNTSIAGEDCWQLFTANLNSILTLKQFNIFVNPTGNQPASVFFFDDFMLAADAAIRFDNMTISATSLKLELGQNVSLFANNQGNPFTWVSSDTEVVHVDQEGMVTAVGDGTAQIRAVPLYGKSVIWEVKVIKSTGNTSPSLAAIADGIHVYPNPNQGRFTLDSFHPIDRLEVFDMMGRLIFDQPGLGQKTHSLILPPGAAGVFFVRVHMQEFPRPVTQHFIVQ